MEINYWYIAAPLIAIYVWQFIANRFDRYRPSWVLVKIADGLTEGFQRLGRFAVYVSSFVEYVHLEMFYVPLFQLLKPLYDIAISWLWFFSSYAESAAKFTNDLVVYWGSFLLMYIITVVLMYISGGYYTEFIWVELRDRRIIDMMPISIWGCMLMSFVVSIILFVGSMMLYYAGMAVHGAIKNLWNDVNKDNVLIAERAAREQKAQAAQKAFVNLVKK